jgi:ribosome maturation factor RimP
LFWDQECDFKETPKETMHMTLPEENTAELIAQLWELLDPVIRAEGMELIELEYRREPTGWVLRIFIDQEDGISVNDCAKISHVAGDLLDVADPIRSPYHLEVSSPGLNRPLRKLEHFRKYLEKIVEVRTATPIDNRRKFKGVLVDVDPARIVVNCEGQVFEIPFTLMERARLCYFESFEG